MGSKLFFHPDLVFEEEIVPEERKLLFQEIMEMDRLQSILIVVNPLLREDLNHSLHALDLIKTLCRLLMEGGKASFFPFRQGSLQKLHAHGKDLQSTIQLVNDPFDQGPDGGITVALDESGKKPLRLRIKTALRNNFPFFFHSLLFFLGVTPLYHKRQSECNGEDRTED